jgi:hypothetical protein
MAGRWRRHKEPDELSASAARRPKRDSRGSALNAGPSAILGLQASAGNAAVSRLVSRVVAPAEPTVRYGSRGPEVAKAQRLLNLAGASLSDDGVFGGLTVRAVKAFQASRGLAPDGVVGPLSWAALHASSGEFAAGEGAAELEGKEGGFEGKEGGFEGKEGGFEGKEGGFEGKEGGFEGKEGGFEGKEGGFEGKEGGFEGKEGGFEGKEFTVEELGGKELGGKELGGKELGGKELGGKEEEGYLW